MHHRQRESGEGRIGCILWGLALIIAALILWQVVPVKMRTAEFYDFMVDQAAFAANRSEQSMKKQIIDKANELDIPVGPKNLTVTKLQARVRMHTEYTIVLEFPFGFTHEWDFVHDVDRPIYYY